MILMSMLVAITIVPVGASYLGGFSKAPEAEDTSDHGLIHGLLGAVAAAVLEKSTWAVLALILEIELFTQEHYKQSIEPEENLSDLYKDVFLFHWKEETTHAIMDELEWPRENKKLTPAQRDQAIDEVIELVAAVDGILQAQCAADVGYFLKICKGSFKEDEIARIKAGVLKAYRWQYIFSGVEHPRFQKLFIDLTTEDQRQRINAALAPLNGNH